MRVNREDRATSARCDRALSPIINMAMPASCAGLLVSGGSVSGTGSSLNSLTSAMPVLLGFIQLTTQITHGRLVRLIGVFARSLLQRAIVGSDYLERVYSGLNGSIFF